MFDVAVPTPVGVNLLAAVWENIKAGRPHARGGEPLFWRNIELIVGAVPTPVGVNLSRRLRRALRRRRPHARGGEPSVATLTRRLVSPSPRPWG